MIKQITIKKSWQADETYQDQITYKLTETSGVKMNKNITSSNSPIRIYDVLRIKNKKKFHLSAAVKNMELALERLDLAIKDISCYHPHWNRESCETLQLLIVSRLNAINSELSLLKSVTQKWYSKSFPGKIYQSGYIDRLIRELVEDVI